MKSKRLSPLIIYLLTLAVIFVIGVGVLAYYNLNQSAGEAANVPLTNGTKACTLEAKQCPDGSYVGRTGPNCEFKLCPAFKPAPTPAPATTLSCTSDADCPSANYSCQATQGYGTVYPDNTQPSTTTITQGECKLKAGNKCGSNNECLASLVCHAGLCAESVSNLCSGPSDPICSQGYQCIQDCGPPVAREGDPAPPYHCLADEIANKPRNCPICLASNVFIDTPNGNVLVTQITKGMKVWSVDLNGNKIESSVIEVTKTPVPKTHQVVHLVMDDKREVWVSANHPLANGSMVGSLKAGDVYSGSTVKLSELVKYWDSFTYDILPDSATGEYFANGILLGSTLLKK